MSIIDDFDAGYLKWSPPPPVSDWPPPPSPPFGSGALVFVDDISMMAEEERWPRSCENHSVGWRRVKRVRDESAPSRRRAELKEARREWKRR